jgi:hypothetical protein
MTDELAARRNRPTIVIGADGEQIVSVAPIAPTVRKKIGRRALRELLARRARAQMHLVPEPGAEPENVEDLDRVFPPPLIPEY